MQALKFSYTVFLLLVIITLINCSKDKTKTSVTGKVIDTTTAAILPNATVYLKAVNPDCFSCQGSTVQTTTTDANGDFSFNFTHESGLIYNVEASYTNYINSTNGGVALTKGEENTATLPLAPKAYIHIFIKNTNPFDGDDVISTGSFGGGGSAFYGMTVDTSIVETTLGNQSLNLVFFVTKNSITTSIQNTIYTPAFDTTNFTISY